ncbi:unnamed protein product [Pieris brassicae]|uniref:Uncharacterized protein n=1 Tax=Pieris brassicae TaxID=7116 RepID=A0A9P0XGU3_PIEBR|nr:unnamed protein product [Pieris brassicae]
MTSSVPRSDLQQQHQVRRVAPRARRPPPSPGRWRSWRTRWTECPAHGNAPIDARVTAVHPAPPAHDLHTDCTQCWDHQNFGERAKQCVKPCDYSQAGNARGNQ